MNKVRTNKELLLATSSSLLIHLSILFVLTIHFFDFVLPEPPDEHEVILVDGSKDNTMYNLSKTNTSPNTTAGISFKKDAKKKQLSPRNTGQQQSSNNEPTTPIATGSNVDPIQKLMSSKGEWQLPEESTRIPDSEILKDTSTPESKQKKLESSPLDRYSAKVRRSVHNHRSFQAAGIEELKRGQKRVFDKYIVFIHGNDIHPKFAFSFLDTLNDRNSKDPINNPKLRTSVEFEILADGRINQVRVVLPSGNLEFDAAAVNAVYDSSPLPPPPSKILSYNDRAYMQWNFNRNNRRCGVFNVEPFIVEEPKRYRSYLVNR